MWEELIASPIVTEWTWSPLVMSIAEQNRDFIHPALQTGASQRTPLPGLIALHIRRGDYPAHCKYLRKHHAPFHGFNQRSDFADHFPLPSNERWAADSQTYYDTHCIPDTSTMVEKVMQVRAAHTGQGTLDRVYILTNGDRAWLREFEDALRARATWASIHSSRDLALSPERKFVAQAADMMIATRAEVFVGNGVRLHIPLNEHSAHSPPVLKPYLHGQPSSRSAAPLARYDSVLVIYMRVYLS